MNNLEISRPRLDTRVPISQERERERERERKRERERALTNFALTKGAFRRLIDTSGRWWLQVPGNGYIGLSAWRD